MTWDELGELVRKGWAVCIFPPNADAEEDKIYVEAWPKYHSDSEACYGDGPTLDAALAVLGEELSAKGFR